MIQQIFIDGHLADISDNTQVTLRHESNLLDVSSIKSNHTLTISLPATVNNRSLFGLPDIVQSTTGEAYGWHDAEYHRDGIPVISGGQAKILKATPTTIDICIVWGMKKAVDAAFASNMTLADIATDAAIEFNATPQLTPYATAIQYATEVFYAGMDTIRHANELEYYHMRVSFQNRSWETNNLMGASSYLHPSVRMNWVLAKIAAANGIAIEFDDPNEEINYMLMPLVSKVPNDITFNGGYKATTSDPSTWGGITGNFIRLKTSNNSAIIEEKTTDPITGVLTCETAFTGLLRFSIYMYIDNLVSVGYPIYRSKYGYRLDVRVAGVVSSCVIIPEGTTFMAQEMDNNNRIGFTIGGSLPVRMNIGETLSIRITCIDGGVADVDLSGGIHVNGGNIWINDIIGSVNEVQPTQMFPVQGNLPNIKVSDLVKCLCVLTGSFPVQASTDDRLIMRQVWDVFDWDNAVDWTSMLLSPTERPVAEETSYTPSGWAKKNLYKWKEDATVVGNYDGGIDVDDDTVDEERTVMTFPFAATDGDNIPMYTSEYKYDSETQTWHAEVKWNKVEPRVLHLDKDGDGNAVGYFTFDMSHIIGTYYYDLVATMEKPVVIVETVRMNDVQFMALDETRPIFLAQHGAYFALLSCELSQSGTAKVELLKLKKMEEV